MALPQSKSLNTGAPEFRPKGNPPAALFPFYPGVFMPYPYPTVPQPFVEETNTENKIPISSVSQPEKSGNKGVDLEAKSAESSPFIPDGVESSTLKKPALEEEKSEKPDEKAPATAEEKKEELKSNGNEEPTGMAKKKLHDGSIFVCETFYRKGLSNLFTSVFANFQGQVSKKA